MSLQYVKSHKGKLQLVHKAFVYTTDRVSIQRTTWKCVNYNKTKCLGRVWTNEVEITFENEKHNHTPDVADIRVKDIAATIKEIAADTTDTPQQILASVTSNLPVSVSGKLPSAAGMKRNINSKRQQGNPKSSTKLSELVIPEEFTLTSKGKTFLLYDNGKASSNRIIIFSTQQNLELLKRCDHWYADGTFKTAPPMFEQVFTIHGIKHNNVVPAVYALLTNKRKDTYLEVLEQLKISHRFLHPVSIMTDFETSQIKAFKEAFPYIQNRGCFFHFRQCFWRQVQTSSDIRSKYCDMDDPDFSLHLRELPALAFVPEEDVEESFKTLMESPFYVRNERLLAPVVDYFEKVWIGKPKRSGQGRHLPKFAMELWNCYNATKEGIPRTNNSVEGWHNAFSSLLAANHPSLWKFIKALQRQQSLTEFTIERYIAGNTSVMSRPNYRDTAARIKKIVDDYKDRTTLEYLQGIAHNLKLQVT